MFDERQYDVIQENSGVGAYTAKVFLWMFIGLLVTAAASYGLWITNLGALFWSNSIVLIAAVIIEFALVYYISNSIRRDMPSSRAKLAFIIYSIVTGITLSGIFYIYNSIIITKAFVTASLTFGVMALYGYVTKKDLSGIAKVLMMLLVGIIIVRLVNIVFALFGIYSGSLDLIISYVSVIVFAGLTAWDTQKIKLIYYQGQGNDAFLEKAAIWGALALYLDFINLFLELLRIFGRSRD